MQRTRWASKGFLSGGSQKLTSRDPVVLDGSRSRVVAFQTFPMTQGPSAGWLAKVGEGWRRLAKVGEQHSCHHENGQAAGNVPSRGGTGRNMQHFREPRSTEFGYSVPAVPSYLGILQN